MHRHFIIKTGQKSPKFLLEQKVSSPIQEAWLTKLMGYDYEIQYKRGKDNTIVDAL